MIIDSCVIHIGPEAVGPPPPVTRTSYSTVFPLTENPISETLNWRNGLANGTNWKNVRTNGTQAYGTQTGSTTFDDSIACMSGTWTPTQDVRATVRTVNQQGSSVFEEVELLLRFSITAGVARGYECNFACRGAGASPYAQIVRWNGPLGNFTYLSDLSGPGLNNGDQIRATISGSTITTYVNGVQVASVSDATWSDGAPGMAFYLQDGASGLTADYGFTAWSVNSVSQTTTFSWGAVAGATSYIFEIGTISGNMNVGSWDTNSALPTYAVSLNPGSYFWRVRTVSAGGTSAPSSQSTVTVS